MNIRQAFKESRAAYARAVYDFGAPVFEAPTQAARIALDDLGVPRHRHWTIMQAVWLCPRPGVERALENMRSQDAEDEQFELRQDEDLFLETDR